MGVDAGLDTMTGRVELGQHMIRVNSVLPTQVSTTMVMNEQTYVFRRIWRIPVRTTSPRSPR